MSGNRESVEAFEQQIASLTRQGLVSEACAAPGFEFQVECVGADGRVKWQETLHNLVTTEGKNHLINGTFCSASQITSWYLGLKGTGSAAAGDTLSSHAGWSEVNPYTGSRKSLSLASSDTSAASHICPAVSFSCTSSATVAGAFVTSASSGTTGTLYSAGDFAASRDVVNTDTLNVTLTLSF